MYPIPQPTDQSAALFEVATTGIIKTATGGKQPSTPHCPPQVRYFGLSNETSYGVSEFCNKARAMNLPKPISIQNSYSLLTRSHFEGDLAEMCRRQGVGLLAYSPLGECSK